MLVDEKKPGKLGLRSVTSTNQGAAISRNSASPGTTCRRRQVTVSRSMRVYSTSAPPASTPTTMPLDSTASAAAAHAMSIQRRSAGAARGAHWASVKANTAAVSQKVKAASSRLMWPMSAKYGLTPSASSAVSARRTSNSHATQANTSGRQAKASPVDHNRELHSCTPNAS